MSIRSRLTIAVAAVLVGTFVLLGVVLVHSARDTLTGQVDDEVRANAARTLGNKGGPPPSKIGDNNNRDDNNGDNANGSGDVAATNTATDTSDAIEIPVARFRYNAQGDREFGEPCGFIDDPKPEPKLPSVTDPEIDLLVNRIVTTPSVDGSLSYRLLVQRADNGDVYFTASPLDAVDSAIGRLIQILVIIGVIGSIAAISVCWLLIARGLRPVDRMVDTAAAIAAGDLSRRVPDADDRTELGRLGGALNEMLGQIESALHIRSESETRLRRFVADAAHELRTPLTSLRGYAELYRQGAIKDEAGVANAMGRIESEGARMARLVDDLLLLARMDQQRGLDLKAIDVAALVEDAATDFMVVAPNHPVTMELTRPVMVQADRVRFRQVIDNLLTNVRVHTPAGTPVHISVTTTGNQAEIAVADKGPGISTEDQEKVFERFWRADPARTRRTGGSGLGLSIVASLVDAQGGTISVESVPGTGTTFRVTMPLAT